MDSINLEDQRGRQCNICYHTFSREGENIPRILSCGHTYCTACLSKLVGKFSRGKVCCPTCKTDTSIPGLVNNVQRLAKNFAVLEILEGLDEVLRGSALTTNQMLLCSEHENEQKKVYCLTDSEVICIYCQVYGPHKGHECQLVSQVASSNRESLAQMHDELSAQKEILLPAWRHLQEISNSVQLKEEKLMREVRHHFDVLRRKLSRREKEVGTRLKSLTSGKVVALHKQCRHIGELMDRVEQFKMACQTYISSPDYEVALKTQSLKFDIKSFQAELPKQDLTAHISNNLACDLSPDLLGLIASHGQIVESQDPENADVCPSTGQVQGPGPKRTALDQQEQSLSVNETSGDNMDASNNRWEDLERSGASGDQGRRHVHPTTRTRQRLQRPDVIIFDNVGDLDEIDPSVCQVRPLCPCHNEGTRGRDDLYVHSGRCRPSDREPVRREDDAFHDVSDVTSNTSSTTPASPDFSDVSDLDLDLPLRSAWSNRGGWSSPNNSLAASQQPGEGGDSVEPNRRAAAGKVSARKVVTEIAGDRRLGGTSEEIGAVGGHDEPDSTSSSDEATPRNPEDTHKDQDSQALHSDSQNHSRPHREPKCSVFNCSSVATTSLYVRCKNCNRVFCQNCISHSVSARRCYKRPRGHSFIYISHPSRPNISANNSNFDIQVRPNSHAGHHHHQHHHHHHRHRRHHSRYQHSHHHQHGSRHHQHNSSSRHHHHRHHLHQQLQQQQLLQTFHQHGSQEFTQSQQQRDSHRSRSRGHHRSGGHEYEENQQESYSIGAVESIFQDLII